MTPFPRHLPGTSRYWHPEIEQTKKKGGGAQNCHEKVLSTILNTPKKVGSRCWKKQFSGGVNINTKKGNGQWNQMSYDCTHLGYDWVLFAWIGHTHNVYLKEPRKRKYNGKFSVSDFRVIFQRGCELRTEGMGHVNEQQEWTVCEV